MENSLNINSLFSLGSYNSNNSSNSNNNNNNNNSNRLFSLLTLGFPENDAIHHNICKTILADGYFPLENLSSLLNCFQDDIISTCQNDPRFSFKMYHGIPMVRAIYGHQFPHIETSQIYRNKIGDLEHQNFYLAYPHNPYLSLGNDNNLYMHSTSVPLLTELDLRPKIQIDCETLKNEGFEFYMENNLPLLVFGNKSVSPFAINIPNHGLIL